MSKSYFGLLDSRNSKYQGLISDDHFAGIGMLIDQTATLALSTWNAHNMAGPSVIIYPTSEIFFGMLQANRPKGLVCYQINRNEKCIINFMNTDSRNRSQQMKIAYLMSGQSVVQVSANPQKNEYKIAQVHYCHNQDDQLKLLSNIFGFQVAKDKIDLISYISKSFVQTSSLFELSGKNQVFFGFKDTISLGFKLENNAPTNVGFFKSFPRNIIFGRKVNYNIALPTKTTVEEGYFDPHVKTFTYLKDKAASLEFQKLSEDYFKKSTTFRNQFVTLDHLNYIHRELKQINEKVKLESAKRFGQTLLENDYGSSHENPNDVVVKEYTLEEMRQEIYKAAAKKNKTGYHVSKSPFRQRVKNPLGNLYLNEIDSPKREVLTVRKTNELTLARNQSILRSRAKQNIPSEDEPWRKGFTYINSNKSEAIKQVDEIIKTKKNEDRFELQSLVNGLKSNEKQSKKKEYNYSDHIDEVGEMNRKYQRYEPKITPFSQANYKGSRSTLKASQGREERYSHFEKAKEEQAVMHHERGLYEVIRRDKSMERISLLGLNRVDTNGKSHSNLEKYKERRKQSNFENLMKKDHKPNYKYLDENEGEFEMQMNRSQIMPEIKLFGEKTIRGREDREHTQVGESDLSKSTHLGGEKSYYKRYEAREKSPVFQRSPHQESYRDVKEINVDLKKNYSRPRLYDNASSSNLMVNYEERRKLKRTFNYVN